MPAFSDKDRKDLLSSPYVIGVSETHVTFSTEFKKKVLELHSQGLSPVDSFNRLGINTSLFLNAYPKKCIARWKKIVSDLGESGLEERRGKKATGRPKKSFDPNDLSSLKERLALLEAENYILKKLQALAMNSVKRKNSK